MTEVSSIGVKVKVSDATIVDCAVEVSQAPPWTLMFSGMEIETQKYVANDLFEAMTALRKNLEATGSLLLCAGARTDVFPSGMSRSMSGGRKAYATRIGLPACNSDMVDIFEYAAPESVGFVEEQRKFHGNWIRSLKGQTDDTVRPLPGEIEEAKRNPNGWVYRIAGRFDPDDVVPPDAIIGAWKVNSRGEIVGGFIKNEKYDPGRSFRH